MRTDRLTLLVTAFWAVGVMFSAIGGENPPKPSEQAKPDAVQEGATKPAPADTTRYTLTLDDDGLLTGVILKKSATQWIVKTDDGKTLEVARARIRQVRVAAPVSEDDKKQSEDRPHGDKPQGERPQGDKPQGDKPQGDRPQGDKPQGDKPAPKTEQPANRGDHPKVTVHLKDGRTVTGTVEKRSDRGALIKTASGEMVEVRMDQVKSIE